jgi:hypothetical protein
MYIHTYIRMCVCTLQRAGPCSIQNIQGNYHSHRRLPDYQVNKHVCAHVAARRPMRHTEHTENFSYTGNYLIIYLVCSHVAERWPLHRKLLFTQEIIIYQVCAHVAERWPMQHTETMVRLAVERTAQVCVLMCSHVFLCVLMCTHGVLGR